MSVPLRRKFLSLPMPAKRFIRTPSSSELSELEEGYKYGRTHDYRIRCQCILFSSQGKSVSELMKIFSVRKHTIYEWFNRYEAEGISGLRIRPGRGRKRKLDIQNEAHVIQVTKSIAQEGRNLTQLQRELEESLGFPISKVTLRRFLKSLVTDTNDSEGA